MGLTPEQEAIRDLEVDLTFVRKRTDQQVVVDGIATSPKDSAVAFKGAIQPLTPRDLRHLPEGQDARDIRNIWTSTELFVNDEIDDGGEIFVVQSVVFWREGQFFKVTALRRAGGLK